MNEVSIIIPIFIQVNADLQLLEKVYIFMTNPMPIPITPYETRDLLRNFKKAAKESRAVMETALLGYLSGTLTGCGRCSEDHQHPCVHFCAALHGIGDYPATRLRSAGAGRFKEANCHLRFPGSPSVLPGGGKGRSALTTQLCFSTYRQYK